MPGTNDVTAHAAEARAFVANDITARAAEVRAFLAEDKLLDATKRLLDFVPDFSHDRDEFNEATVISAERARIERAFRTDDIKFEDKNRLCNRLIQRILELLDAIESRPPDLRMAS